VVSVVGFGGPEVIVTVGAGGFTVHEREAVAGPVMFDVLTTNVWRTPAGAVERPVSVSGLTVHDTGFPSSVHVTGLARPTTVQLKVALVLVV